MVFYTDLPLCIIPTTYGLNVLKSQFICYVSFSMLILQKYLDCIEQLYKLKPENVDFKNNLEEARTQINAWIENKTKGKR